MSQKSTGSPAKRIFPQISRWNPEKILSLLLCLLFFLPVSGAAPRSTSASFTAEETTLLATIDPLLKQIQEQCKLTLKTHREDRNLSKTLEKLNDFGYDSVEILSELRAYVFLCKIRKGDRKAWKEFQKNKYKIGLFSCGSPCKACHATGNGGCTACKGTGICALCNGSGSKKDFDGKTVSCPTVCTYCGGNPRKCFPCKGLGYRFYRIYLTTHITHIEREYSDGAKFHGMRELLIANCRNNGSHKLTKDPSRAAELYRRAAQAGNPTGQLLHIWYQYYRIDKNQNQSAAEKALQPLLKKSYPAAYCFWAMILTNQGEYAGAFKFFQKGNYPGIAGEINEKSSLQLQSYNYPTDLGKEILLSAVKCIESFSYKYEKKLVDIYTFADKKYPTPVTEQWLQQYTEWRQTPISCPHCSGRGYVIKYENRRVKNSLGLKPQGAWDGYFYLPVAVGKTTCPRCGGSKKTLPGAYDRK